MLESGRLIPLRELNSPPTLISISISPGVLSRRISRTVPVRAPSANKTRSPTSTSSIMVTHVVPIRFPSWVKSLSMTKVSTSFGLSTSLPSICPQRILGPCKSNKIPTERLSLAAVRRTKAMAFRIPAASLCEQLTRQTSIPADKAFSRVSGWLILGPRVATILVLRMCCNMGSPIKYIQFKTYRSPKACA